MKKIIKKTIKKTLSLFKKKQELHIGFDMPIKDVLSIPVWSGFNHVGIVLQGPVDKKEDFTINTIRILRHIYPDIQIVLSTWVGEVNEVDRKELIRLNCDIVEDCGLPSELLGEGRKVGHLNNQLLSSINGIKRLKDKGIKYAMKMRTDTRIYKYDFIPYFLNLLKVFPCPSSSQKERLVNIAYGNTLASVPFHMCDFIWFGTIEDMERLYSIPTRTDETIAMIRNLSKEQLEGFISKFWERAGKYDMRDVVWLNASEDDKKVFYSFHEESYIMHTYAERNGLCDDKLNPLDAYYRYLKEYVIIVDEGEMFAYFDKYDYTGNRNIYSSPFFVMGHSEWLDLMLNYEN